MVEYRTARRDEREEYIDLANLAFKMDFESMIPKVYGRNIESFSLHKVAVDEQGRLRAQVAVLPETLIVCDCMLRVGYLGIVSVHPRARGEGHMKALMNMWIEETRETCDLVVLDGQRQRYEYFGFTLGGMKIKYNVEKANVRHALVNVSQEGLSFRPLFEIEGASAFAQRINMARPAYVNRDVLHLPAIFNNLNQTALGLLDEGRLIGYLIANRAGNEISELAMENTEDVLRAIKAYMAYLDADSISICTPEYDMALNASLGSFAENYVIETSNMYDIVDFAHVMKAYLTLKHRTSGLLPGEFSAVMNGQPVTAYVNENGVTIERSAKPGAVVLSKQQAQTFLLTPHGRHMAISAPPGWFPLPLFWYTVDKF